jgi:hypothetical protein
MPCNKDASRLAFADRSRERTANGLRYYTHKILSFSKFFLSLSLSYIRAWGVLGLPFFLWTAQCNPKEQEYADGI